MPLEKRVHFGGGLCRRAVFRQLNQRHQLVGDSGQCRHDDERRALRFRLLLPDDADETVDSIRVRYGGPAELHDDTHSDTAR